MTTTTAYSDLPDLVGSDLGFTDWRTITQEQVNTFADATDDHQWIHTDPERAKDGPFGAPIAHGFLTLSLLIPMWESLLTVDGVSTKVNYGLDKVRFVSPVKVGARIRMTAAIAGVTEVAGGYQLTVDVTIEIEGGAKPAVVARSLQRFYA
ncbi:MaoC family dehydratase [Arthrobacter sp. zg-ZUI100]|uniref:MaoC family dehydratase n=1 Tax=Arthrobacter gengyunqii TaxID=2886940 RepID=A0A9X1M0P5_9MICC|nr:MULTISPECIES: MaoC family dehydratase [Arthrobacter]MBP3035404.1 MaoC family dehydratase [Arthrobacter jiangjiafuii]MCC3268552.1 MaoC family dehydratase [Arthrobacter gengyunqii]UOY95940.1 MaoC family dehydratase [Arthrobacter gengyunqii]